MNREDYGTMWSDLHWNDTDDQANDRAPAHGVAELPFVVPEPDTAQLILARLSSLVSVRQGALRLRGRHGPPAAPPC